MRKQTGFTLIEIAIVLVIIGLLLGGVLKGQELIQNAKVRNLIQLQDGVKAAYFGFQDRYQAVPGDYAQAAANINCGATPCNIGNGNGLIESAATPVNSSVPREDILAWQHLSASGFLNGSYAYNATVSTSTNLTSPYSVAMQLINDNVYDDSASGTPSVRLNLKTGNQIPADILSQIDLKIDDGVPNTGSFRFSVYAPAGNAPTSAGCYNTATSPAQWDAAGNVPTNCGGASLLQ